jgi:hypothetical protein
MFEPWTLSVHEVRLASRPSHLSHGSRVLYMRMETLEGLGLVSACLIDC